ncbi:DUF397 domain-containing protein [Nocardiopsis sp. M1B1]|uniref:DUF397 domain-containing protein n=1 Tax=Nocardiopsis sp. M1B1 TaxID=3450454 RepID=UPI00403A1110
MVTVRNDGHPSWEESLRPSPWKKPSRSYDKGQCCEVCVSPLSGVFFRDSVHPTGPILVFLPSAWLSLVKVLS